LLSFRKISGSKEKNDTKTQTKTPKQHQKHHEAQPLFWYLVADSSVGLGHLALLWGFAVMHGTNRNWTGNKPTVIGIENVMIVIIEFME